MGIVGKSQGKMAQEEKKWGMKIILLISFPFLRVLMEEVGHVGIQKDYKVGIGTKGSAG